MNVPYVSSGGSAGASSVFGIGAPQQGSSQVVVSSHTAQLGAGSSVIGIGAPQTGSVKCQATTFGKSKYAYADQWCQAQCHLGNCPSTYCGPGCRLFG